MDEWPQSSECGAGGHSMVAVHEHLGQCQHTGPRHSPLGVQCCKLCVLVNHQWQPLTGLPNQGRAFEACPEEAVGPPGSPSHQPGVAACMAAPLVSQYTAALPKFCSMMRSHLLGMVYTGKDTCSVSGGA